MQEKAIEKKFAEKARRLGLLTYKMASPYVTGWPDRLVLLPGGQTLFIEFKTPRGKVTPKQAYIHGQIRSIGHEVVVCTSAEDALEQCQKKI